MRLVYLFVFGGLFCSVDWSVFVLLSGMAFFMLYWESGMRASFCGLFRFSSVRWIFIGLVLLVSFIAIISSIFDFLGMGYFRFFCYVIIARRIFLCLCFFVENLFCFYFLFEGVFVLFFLLLLTWGYSPERLQASLYMLFYTLIVSFPFLIFILELRWQDNGVFGYKLMASESFFLWWGFSMLVFFVKIPVFYVHLWLPKAHVEAPLVGSIVLAGVLLKLGVYGCFRVFAIVKCFISFWLGVLVSLFMWGGSIIGLVCLRQVDMKALVAYSSVCHIGYCLSSLFRMSFLGVLGSFVLVVRHGFVSSCLFMILFSFYCRSFRRGPLVLKGLIWRRTFLIMWWFVFCFLNISVPPSFGFFGEIFGLIRIIGGSFFAAFIVGFCLIVGGLYGVYLFVCVSQGLGGTLLLLGRVFSWIFDCFFSFFLHFFWDCDVVYLFGS